MEQNCVRISLKAHKEEEGHRRGRSYQSARLIAAIWCVLALVLSAFDAKTYKILSRHEAFSMFDVEAITPIAAILYSIGAYEVYFKVREIVDPK